MAYPTQLALSAPLSTGRTLGALATYDEFLFGVDYDSGVIDVFDLTSSGWVLVATYQPNASSVTGAGDQLLVAEVGETAFLILRSASLNALFTYEISADGALVLADSLSNADLAGTEFEDLLLGEGDIDYAYVKGSGILAAANLGTDLVGLFDLSVEGDLVPGDAEQSQNSRKKEMLSLTFVQTEGGATRAVISANTDDYYSQG